ncbi:hypothetical protein EV667_3860 [Ancylobacter aquaticus]|uniref:DUF1269 domain-containing protein n=1 Tax=Ancylobacter aquaticus TaxID=100 RepID=A0A4R1HZY5_ANCAQ|nr:hypothetical protein [Ancylobacter aquaticus]TCK23182.1 hypothetical protein EV667_3860 [Ancylobacter aquaticus]
MSSIEPTDDVTTEYSEREAVAVFSSEAALHAAVDSLLQIGLEEKDMSVLGAHGAFSLKSLSELEEAGDVPRGAYVPADERAEGLAALAGSPALVAGLCAALVAGTGGAALIPAIAVTAGSTAAGGVVGLLLARVFGRKHAAFIERQIGDGGLLLWVHAPDTAKDTQIAEILAAEGGKDVHFHTVQRQWTLHALNPDPLLRI